MQSCFFIKVSYQQKEFEKIIFVPGSNVFIYLSFGSGFRYQNNGEKCGWI